jgi:hypothetical protein
MDPKRIKVGDFEVGVMEKVPEPDDKFMCSHCLSSFAVRDLTIVPSFDQGRGWTGAYRCPGDRAQAFEAARSALLFGGLSETQLVDFLATVDRWNVPPVALRPFTSGESLESAVLTILDLLERRVVRLSHGLSPAPEGTREIFLAIDAILACLIAPRGHAVDHALLPMLRTREARAILLDFAIKSAMCALRSGDTLDTERWAGILAYSEIERAKDAPDADPSPEEIEHWRAVVEDGSRDSPH